MTLIKLFLSLLITTSAIGELHFFFTPPDKWIPPDPKTLNPAVEIAFLAPSKGGVRPSINLATEKVSLSTKEYFDIVVKNHKKKNPHSYLRNLGSIVTKAGDAHLLEFDGNSDGGPTRFFQLILVKEGTACVITAFALKKEFQKHYKEFKKAFTSLTLTDDLSSFLSDTSLQKLSSQIDHLNDILPIEDRESSFTSKHFQKKQWLPFTENLLIETTHLGGHWQMLFLKKTQKALLSRQNFLNYSISKKENSVGGTDEKAL